MGTDVQTAELEAQEEDLITRIDQLDRSYPSDGWDGVAYAIAAHVRNIRGLEEQLAEIHEQLGRHCTDRSRYYPEGKCFCGQPVIRSA